MGKRIEIQNFCSCCDKCNEYLIPVIIDKSINADTGKHINLEDYIICNPPISFIEDDIDNPPNFSRAFRKNCIQCWDVVNGSNRTRHFNNVENFNCVEERIMKKLTLK